MTRQITKQAVKAFMQGENFKLSNTEVKANCKEIKMYLFGNCIAERVGERIRVTLAGYNTNTTRERLNGIPNCKISQKNFIPYLNGKEINSNEWYPLYEIEV